MTVRTQPHLQDVLYLIPNGYPLTIVVPEKSIFGTGSAMQFWLPLNGHNLPLMHTRESKLLVALDGEVEIRSNQNIIALLKKGQALALPSNVNHRVYQHGATPSHVGVALWPGHVEDAFRCIARQVAADQYSRDEMIRTFASYGVIWTAKSTEEHKKHEVMTFAEALHALPLTLAGAIQQCWLPIFTDSSLQ